MSHPIGGTTVVVPARENPFRVERTDSLRFQFSTGTWSSHMARLKALRFRASIEGPQGSGKSTLLTELSEHLRNAGLKPVICRATADPTANGELIARLTESMNPGQVILLDSAEKLSRLTWWRLLWRSNRRVGLVVTVHRRCGLPTWVRCDSSWELLRSLLQKLDFLDDHNPVIAAARDQYVAHRGNIRDIFRELFDEMSDGRLNAIAQNKLMAFRDS